MLNLLVVAIALLALAIVVLGYVWILAPRKTPAPRLATGVFEGAFTHPWASGSRDNRRDLR
jgi:hypothetical protein